MTVKYCPCMIVLRRAGDTLAPVAYYKDDGMKKDALRRSLAPVGKWLKEIAVALEGDAKPENKIQKATRMRLKQMERDRALTRQ